MIMEPDILWISVQINGENEQDPRWIVCSPGPLPEKDGRLLLTIVRCQKCGHYHNIMQVPGVTPCYAGPERHPLEQLEEVLMQAHISSCKVCAQVLGHL